MAAPDLSDLLRQYARRGLADFWNKTPAPVQRNAGICLGQRIAQHHSEADITIHTIYNGDNAARLRFIPIPRHPSKAGVYPGFFIPVRRIAAGGVETASFELFVLVRNTDSLAFRFEPAHPAPSTHNYGHVQMSRQILQGSIPVRGVPEWLPTSYPAIFSPMPDPLRTFLGMTVALHGNLGGAETVIREIFQSAGRPRDATVYLGLLKNMLS